jgi:hypothetical protein
MVRWIVGIAGTNIFVNRVIHTVARKIIECASITLVGIGLAFVEALG